MPVTKSNEAVHLCIDDPIGTSRTRKAAKYLVPAVLLLPLLVLIPRADAAPNDPKGQSIGTAVHYSPPLPPCATEDSTATPCKWNAIKRSNGRGLSFKIDAKGKRHYFSPDFTQALPPCANEDGPGPCRWLAGSSGNGVGHSFWIDSMACFHYLKAKDDRKWGDHSMPCEDPYELDKTAKERACQDAAAEGDESVMARRFTACTKKYGH